MSRQMSMGRTLFLSAAFSTLVSGGAFAAEDAQPAAAASAPAPAAVTTYQIDPAKTELVAQVFKAGVAARLAHNHVIRAKDVSGVLEYDPARPQDAKLNVTVKTKSLRVDETRDRKKYGLAGIIDAGDQETITENMQDEDQLWVSKYPTLSFASKSFQPNSDGTLTVQGNFTVRGVTKPVSVQAVLAPHEGDAMRGTAKLKFLQSQFGYEPYEAMLGAIKVEDEVTVHIELVARPKK